MQVRTHILVSAAVAVMLYPFIGLNALTVFFFGFIIDIDHPLLCAVMYRELSLRQCKERCALMERTKDVTELNRWLLVFHTAEFLVLLLVLSYWWDYALYALIGTVLHLALDTISRIRTFNDLGQQSIIAYSLSRMS
jgi:hypothetical protein